MAKGGAQPPAAGPWVGSAARMQGGCGQLTSMATSAMAAFPQEGSTLSIRSGITGSPAVKAAACGRAKVMMARDGGIKWTHRNQNRGHGALSARTRDIIVATATEVEREQHEQEHAETQTQLHRRECQRRREHTHVSLHEGATLVSALLHTP